MKLMNTFNLKKILYSSKAFDVTNEFERSINSLKHSFKELPKNVTFNDINYEIEIRSDFIKLTSKVNESKSIEIDFETSIDDFYDYDIDIEPN